MLQDARGKAGLVFMKVFEFVIPSAGFSTGLPIGKCPLSLKDGKLTKEIASLALIRAVSELSCTRWHLRAHGIVR
ncbi:hypothetical protein ASL22_00730 [Alcaligenes faecalis]|nr:hypothetical protein ASL22_00730 [Alcaligenes faecalis]